jgi:peptidase A4-like protein
MMAKTTWKPVGWALGVLAAARCAERLSHLKQCNMKSIASLLHATVACIVFVGCSGAPDSSASGEPTKQTTAGLTSATTASPVSSVLPAYALAWPGADCTLQPDGNTDEHQSLDVIADDDGIVYFYSARLSSGDPAARQSLECKDEQGRSGAYVVDLSTASPFQKIHVAADHPSRPPLAGSPSDYSTLELIQMGYGLRPDMNKSPSAYALWLADATKTAIPVMYSHAPRQTPNGQTGTIGTPPNYNWTGPVFTPSIYQATFAEMQAPEVIPGGDGISGGQGSLWGGMGGTQLFGSDPSILQDGVEWVATSTTATFDAWIQYYPDLDSPQFPASATDEIHAEAWACNSTGGIDFSGGFGCFFIEDTTTGSFRSCTSQTGTCKSIMAPSTFLGLTAEFILEKKTTFMPDHFSAPMSLAEAEDTSDSWETFGEYNYDLATITGVHGGLIDFASVDSQSVSFSFNNTEGGD